MKCADCKFFKGSRNIEGSYGDCRRRPPQMVVTRPRLEGNLPRVTWAWPRVLTEDWCGEYVNRETQLPY